MAKGAATVMRESLEFATAMTLTFSSPFFIVIFSIFFLKDRIGIYRWSAIFLGFLGVVLIMKPTSDIFNFYSIFPILTAIAWAMTVIILKFIPEELHFYSFKLLQSSQLLPTS